MGSLVAVTLVLLGFVLFVVLLLAGYDAHLRERSRATWRQVAKSSGQMRGSRAVG